MADNEKIQKEKHRRFIDALAVVMLASESTWRQSAGHFRDYLDGAVQVATRAVYRDNEEDRKIVEDAERVVGNLELLANLKAGGTVQ